MPDPFSVEEFDENPFRAPESLGGEYDTHDDPEAVAIRNQHLSHEASVKSMGFLYILSGILLTVFSVAGIAGSFFETNASPAEYGQFVVLVGVVGIIALYQLYVGVKLRQLHRAGRLGGGILSTIGLIGFPIGTIINGYFLYLLFSKKGEMVFSDRYQDVIAQTPEIQYRTSMIVKIFAALLFAVIALGIVMAVLG